MRKESDNFVGGIRQLLPEISVFSYQLALGKEETGNFLPPEFHLDFEERLAAN